MLVGQLVDEQPDSTGTYTVENGKVRIDPTARVSPLVEVEAGVYIGPYAVVERCCVLGRGVYVDSKTQLHGDVHVGAGVSFYNDVIICDGAEIGEKCTIGLSVYVGYDAVLGKGCVLRAGCRIGSTSRIGRHSSLGAESRLAPDVRVGEDCSIGSGCVFGSNVEIGDYCQIGENTTLSKWVRIGDGVRLPAGSSSEKLATEIRTELQKTAPFHLFWKWVTPYRLSPGFGSASVVSYEKGSVVEEPDAVASDQQCAKGLHVFLPGHKPEWEGLCEPGAGYIPLLVKVMSEDILFAGLPGNASKFRVRKLEVLT